MRDTWLDGTWVYPLPLDPSQLSLGKHTWTLGLTDIAGNGNKVTFTFLVTTSFADIDALLARYGTGGTIPAADVTALRASLASAKSAADGGDAVTAVSRPGRLRLAGPQHGRQREGPQPARHRRPGRHAPGARHPGRAGPGRPRRHDRALPGPAAPPVRDAGDAGPRTPNAKFKVLVIANKNDGSFRHPAIEDAEVMLQQLGAAKGFDVDLWDPSWPAQSLPDTPFTSAAEPGPVRRDHRRLVGRQQHVQRRLHDEGRHRRQRAGRVQGLHQQRRRLRRAARRQRLDAHLAGARRRPLWYQNFLGGLFVSHPANQNGVRHRLRLLLLGRAHHRGPVAPVDRRRRQAA